ncbi:hypothetical protein D9M69_612460 [compost metagenome]
MPTAPFILPRSLTLAIFSRAAARRTTTLASSLPTVVGLAVWPWVRLSMGTAAKAWAISRSLVITASSAGSSTASRPPLSCSAWLVLLMSSLVQAKCTNSAAFSSSGRASNLDLIQYSTALTSWLVTFSMSLMAWPSASLKFFARPMR